MVATIPQATAWLLRQPPDDARRLLFCFPYAGVGASSYRQWPKTIAGTWICPLQPPGRENRLREPPHRTHRAFADDLIDAIAGYLDRPFSLAGHCGAVPYALETILRLQDGGLRLPGRLFASSWGPPHLGLYGRLNFVDLRTVDLAEETFRLFAGMSGSFTRELATLAARVLRVDLEVQRPYRYDASRFLPCPVTALAWSHDDVVPPGQVHDNAWRECADVAYELLDGDHLDFLRCPPNLQELIARELARPSDTDGTDRG